MMDELTAAERSNLLGLCCLRVATESLSETPIRPASTHPDHAT
jgi:hypothetical protein